MRPTTKVGDLEEFYGIVLDAPPQLTLDEAIRRRLGPLEVRVGRSVRVGQIELRIRSLTHRGAIDGLSMVILPPDEESAGGEGAEGPDRIDAE